MSKRRLFGTSDHSVSERSRQLWICAMDLCSGYAGGVSARESIAGPPITVGNDLRIEQSVRTTLSADRRREGVD